MKTAIILAAVLLAVLYCAAVAVHVLRSVRRFRAESGRGVGNIRYDVLSRLIRKWPPGTLLLTADADRTLYITHNSTGASITSLEMDGVLPPPHGGCGIAAGVSFTLACPRRDTVTRAPFGYRVERDAAGRIAVPEDAVARDGSYPWISREGPDLVFSGLVYATADEVDSLVFQLYSARPFARLPE